MSSLYFCYRYRCQCNLPSISSGLLMRWVDMDSSSFLFLRESAFSLAQDFYLSMLCVYQKQCKLTKQGQVGFSIISLNLNNSNQFFVKSPMDTFRVYSRCRPLNELEVNYGASRKAVSILDSTTICINDGNTKEHIFQLDGVFDENTCNMSIFNEAVLPLIENVIYGINSTVFAYGITGAGKSFTMFGGSKTTETPPLKQSYGLIPLTFKYLVQVCASEEDTKLKVSYLEIYNEQVFDLLQPYQQNLQLSEDPIQGCVIVQDLTEIELHSVEEAEDLIAVGNSRRVVAETKANEVSSRSHAIVIISIERRINNSDQFYSAKLSLVDLAGSQKQSVHSETRGIRTFEGSNINRSLLTLGNCINILSQKRKVNSGATTTQFIPYRDSKLTRLLKDSLGGNTKTVMIACISPSSLYYDETLNTLKYACRANKIEKIVQQNIREAKTLEEYKKQIALLKKENEILRINLQTSYLSNGCENKKSKIAESMEKLTKIIEQRVVLMAMSGSEGRIDSIEKMVRAEEQIKMNILDEFSVKKVKKTEGLKFQGNNQNNSKKRVNNSKGREESQNKPYETKLGGIDLNKAKNRERISIPSGAQSKNNICQYKLSLKEQLKNEGVGQMKIKNYSLINLQNLRKKVMEDKKQISNFKQEMIERRLSPHEIQAKASKLLRMGEDSILRLSEEEIEYLKKIQKGDIENVGLDSFLSPKKRTTNLAHQPDNLTNHPFTLNILEENGGEHSRNRHLVTLNRIISMARGNMQVGGQGQNYDRSSKFFDDEGFTSLNSEAEDFHENSRQRQLHYEEGSLNEEYVSQEEQQQYF